MSQQDIETLHEWAKQWSYHRDTPLSEKRLWRQIAAETRRFLDESGAGDDSAPVAQEVLFS